MLKLLKRLVLLLVALIVLVPAAFWGWAQWRERLPVEALMPQNGMLIATGEGRMHVSLWGPEGGTPVVMTHGMAAWGGLWGPTAEALAGRGYRVIAVDLPPFGFSDRQDGDYSRIRQARRINALAAAMNLRNYLMVGHSYGGGVALEAALGDAAGERRLAGLVLVCAVVNLLAEGESEAPKAAPALLTVPIVSDALVAGTIGNPLLTATLARRFMHRKEGLTARDVEILQRPMARRGNGKAMLAWLTQFLAEDDAPLSRHAEKVRQLAVPVSLVWGEEDMVTPIAGGEALAAEINPRAFFRLKGIGHMPQLEDRDGFAGVLLDALDALPGHDGGPSEGVGELRGTHDAAPQ